MVDLRTVHFIFVGLAPTRPPTRGCGLNRWLVVADVGRQLAIQNPKGSYWR